MSGRRRSSAVALAGLLCLAVVAVYGQTVEHDFVNYDDPVFFIDNPALAHGLSAEGLSWALVSQRAANWFPMTRLTLLLDAEVHDASPAGAHLTNLVLHAGSTVLLFFALLRMTGRLGPSAFVAGVFALHPLQVESVAWASERKGLLSGFFWMATLFVYAGAGREPLTLRRGLAVFALVVLGLASKLAVATLPFVLLLLDYWPLGRLRRDGSVRAIDGRRLWRALQEKVPMGLAVLAAVGLVFQAQSSGGAVASLDQVPWIWRLGNAVVGYGSYAALFVWPHDLAVFHPHPGSSLPAWQVAVAGCFLVVTSGLAIRYARPVPAVTVGWLWYLGTLVPMIGLVHLGSHTIAERYAYLPLVGLALAPTWFASDRLADLRSARWVLPSLGVCLLFLLGVASHRQTATWRDSETLFRHAIGVTERNHVGHLHLAHALLAQGRDVEAIGSYREAIDAHHGYSEALNNLAWLLATHPDPGLRDPRDAVRLGREAVRITGGSDPSSLDTLAAAYASAGRFDLASLTAGKAASEARRELPSLVPDILERRDSYRARRAYVEAAQVPGHVFDRGE